ncbi:MAG: hypothetical protein IPO67_04825 [Deltaproteobacteria bacterium]|nr:hypothetical protein [Deltaproteobacteria bacterium]
MLEYQPKSKSTPNNPQSSQAEADQSAQPSSLALQSNSAQSAQLGLNEGSWFSSGSTEKKSSTSWFSSWFGGADESKTQAPALGPVNNNATSTATGAKAQVAKPAADAKAAPAAEPKKGGPYTDNFATKTTNPDLKVDAGPAHLRR